MIPKGCSCGIPTGILQRWVLNCLMWAAASEVQPKLTGSSLSSLRVTKPFCQNNFHVSFQEQSRGCKILPWDWPPSLLRPVLGGRKTVCVFGCRHWASVLKPWLKRDLFNPKLFASIPARLCSFFVFHSTIGNSYTQMLNICCQLWQNFSFNDLLEEEFGALYSKHWFALCIKV